MQTIEELRSENAMLLASADADALLISTAAMHQTEMRTALTATLPALVLLGNYIGNEWKGGGGIDAFDRCALIAMIHTLTAKA